jgi:hypothetical protein
MTIEPPIYVLINRLAVYSSLADAERDLHGWTPDFPAIAFDGNGKPLELVPASSPGKQITLHLKAEGDSGEKLSDVLREQLLRRPGPSASTWLNSISDQQLKREACSVFRSPHSGFLSRLGCLLLIVLFPLPILTLITNRCWFMPSDIWFRWWLKRNARYIRAKDLAELPDGPAVGTIIVDIAHSNGFYNYVWWTPDDVMAKASMPVPPKEDRYPSLERHDFNWSSFDRWLWWNYLHHSFGSASQVGISVKPPSEGIFDLLSKQYPRRQVIRSYSGGRELEGIWSDPKPKNGKTR